MAPYWADADLRREGRVRYESMFLDDDDSGRLQLVNEFIRAERNSSYEGEWMLLVEWGAIHPFPHGDLSDEQILNPESAILNQVRKHTHVFTQTHTHT